MRKIREILRLRHERKLSNRQIAAATAVSRETVSKYLRRAEAAGMTWDAACDFTDVEVADATFPICLPP
jgi:transcriptional regulator with XRE-family HTH domain